MARKIIITVAPVCHVGKEIPAGCKNPLTPEEITEDVINCYKAGACEVHLHTRDLKGNPTFELDVFSDTIRRIREQSDMIIQSSTGGLSSLSLEQRCVCLNVPEVEVASLNLGSVNFGETVYVNTMPELRYCHIIPRYLVVMRYAFIAPIASESPASCVIVSFSPRIMGSMPACSSQAAASVRSVRNAAHSPFSSVFRRRAKAAFTTRKNISSLFTFTAGSLLTGSRINVLSTFGGGVKQDAGTSITRCGSH